MIGKTLLFLLSGIALLTLSYSVETQTKYSKRDGKWEASFQLLNCLSTDINGENVGQTGLISSICR
ncbi:MAG: hypothetical protein COB83_13260 [Gammaproteobacteria bacterium]|nr:MAG: hypothetical protein COB83_13260 [Gammaproteobacteria bacterium]